MTYEWNALWTEPADDISPEYVASIHRMIIASINWIADNPDADPAWTEPDRRRLAKAAGIPDHIPIYSIAFTGNWEDFFIPKDRAAASWFNAISEACEGIGGPENAPSAFMFTKAVGCGLLLKKIGWEEFNRFMLEPRK